MQRASALTVFVIADLHFGDTALCGRVGRGRPFTSVAEMAEVMRARWNATVSKSDEVYVLGDVGRGRAPEPIREMHGRKHLVAGNGDDILRLANAAIFETIVVAKRLPGVLLTHIPVHPTQLGRGLINVHGHLHGRSIDAPDYVCVSAEHVDYQPILLSDVMQRASGMSTRSSGEEGRV